MSRTHKTAGSKQIAREVKAYRRQQPALPTDHGRPRIRAECPPHPCPFVGCRHHLYLDVTPAGSIAYNFAGEPHEMQVSCALDVAAPREQHEGSHREGLTLEAIGGIFGVTRERIRQMECVALARVRAAGLEPNEPLDYARGLSFERGT